MIAEWEFSSQIWVNSAQVLYEYDREKDPVEYVSQYWNENQQWENSRRVLYIYKKVLDIPEIMDKTTLDCKWDEASQERICITCSGLEEGEPYTAAIYSLEGNLVSSRGFSSNQSFYIDRPPSAGIYLLIIRDHSRTIFRSKMFIH